jgi:transcriptional regulator with XRE-family HTH domain
LHVARRFERLLDAHRWPDGSRWTGQQLDEATGGGVTRSYVTNLRKGRIENPGYEKLKALVKAMGFARRYGLRMAWATGDHGTGRRVSRRCR